MYKFISSVLIMLSSITAAHAQGYYSQNAYAKNFDIDYMDVTSIRIEAPFFKNESKSMTLNVITSENLVGGYISAITSTFIGAGGEQILYTAESNRNLHGTATPAGQLPGGPVPSGTVDMKNKTISVDMSSLFSAHGPMDQNLGGIATGTYTPGTGEYTMSWTATLTQGGNAGKDVTFVFSGNAHVVPVSSKHKKYKKHMKKYMKYMK